MTPRYFVRYKRFNGTVTEDFTTTLGRFDGQSDAEESAQKRFGVCGSEVTAVRPETPFEAARYKVYRFVVRSVRIASAVGIAFFAYLWLHDSMIDTGDIPLGSLTANMLMSNLGHGALMIGAAWLCWVLAFGEGPQK